MYILYQKIPLISVLRPQLSYCSGLPRSVSQTLHDTTLHNPSTVLPIRPIHSNKSTAALIVPTPAIPQFFRQENYLLSGWNKISSQAVLQRYFRDDGIPPPYDLPTILSAASNASNNGIDICLGRGSATAALVARYTANGRCFASKWWCTKQVHSPIYWCVDEQMITTPNKRMDTASIHSYKTVCASIATGGGWLSRPMGYTISTHHIISIIRLGVVWVIQHPMAWNNSNWVLHNNQIVYRSDIYQEVVAVAIKYHRRKQK